MKLLKYLANLGYGSRREVGWLLDEGRVKNSSGEVLHERSAFDPSALLVDGVLVDPAPGVVLLMNKPVGYTCSTRDPNRIVYDLLPPRFRVRSPIIAPIGRLDRETSGLLLFTDDGALQHRITSPKKLIEKTYLANLAQPLRGDEAQVFASGSLMLEGETKPLLPAKLHVIDALNVEIKICEGRYHQVRRMFAAVGNHVAQLQRTSIGALRLDAKDVAEGSWRIISAEECAKVFAAP
jgi:16S rRNA pseudouridine516 synthase